MPENTVVTEVPEYYTSQESLVFYEDELGAMKVFGEFQQNSTFDYVSENIERRAKNFSAIKRAYGIESANGTIEMLELFDGKIGFAELIKLRKQKKKLKIRQFLGKNEALDIVVTIDNINLTSAQGADATCSLTWSSDGDLEFITLPEVPEGA